MTDKYLKDISAEMGLEFIYYDSYRDQVVYKMNRPIVLDRISFELMYTDKTKKA